MALTLFVV